MSHRAEIGDFDDFDALLSRGEATRIGRFPELPLR
jgi:hypothetical protein